MDKEAIVREVVNVIEKKGLLQKSAKKFSDLESPLKIVKLQDPLSRVTIGTAGKVFSGQPGEWKPLPKPLPINMDELPFSRASGCAVCSSLKQMTQQELQALGADRLGICHPTATATIRSIARMIDHTLLRPNATQQEVTQLCEEAKRYCFASVCVNPTYVALASCLLKGSGVKLCTVVGFPLGSSTSTVKALEAQDAIHNGAEEIDMVMNVSALKSGNFQLVLDDIRAVRETTSGKILKVILETSLLTREEKIKASQLAKEAGADFVKTSTGFSSGGATVDDIQLMRRTVGPKMGVKASGGIKDIDFARRLVEAGATRIGSSASIAIAADISGDE